MAKLPNVSTKPNAFGGVDTQHFGGAMVRTAFEDGANVIYVQDSRGVHEYEVRLSYLTPYTLLMNTIHATLLNALGVRGAQREELMARIEQTQNESLAAWKRDNNI